MVFNVGDKVQKYQGEYGGPGVVVGRFKTLSGKWRYNVAHKIEGGFGSMIHIYTEAQIRKIDDDKTRRI